MNRQTLIVLLLTALPFSVKAQEAITVGELLAKCEIAKAYIEGTNPKTVEAMIGATECSYYLDGFMDAAAIFTSKIAMGKVCFPKNGVPLELATDMLKTYTQYAPNEANETARISLAIILAAAYPCPRAP